MSGEQKEKKKNRKGLRFFIILVIVIVVIIIIFANMGGGSTSDIPAIEEFIPEEYSLDFSYDLVARNADEYKNNKYKVTGRVIQLTNTKDTSTDMRVALNNDSDQTIYLRNVSIDNSKFLEDDYITIYAVVLGEHSYTSIMNQKITLPELHAVKVSDYNPEIDREASQTITGKFVSAEHMFAGYFNESIAVITLEISNKTDKDSTPLWDIDVELIQNNEILETSYIDLPSGYLDSDSKLLAGVTKNVSFAFSLDGYDVSSPFILRAKESGFSGSIPILEQEIFLE